MFREAQARLKGPGVEGWWDQVLPELDEERREALLAAAVDRTIMHRTISVVLKEWGYDVTAGKVAYWRRNHVG